jgi:phytoene dehydrogenase-like protein
MSGTLDVIVVGSGPNGLAGAIYLQQKGLSTMVFEGADLPGGSVSTRELTLPGFKHDLCSAIHPLAVSSPFFCTLPLKDHGLSWIFPDIPFAHPMENGKALAVYRDLAATAGLLGSDRNNYEQVFGKLVQDWEILQHDVLGPVSWPADLRRFLRFIPYAIPSAKTFVHRHFKEADTRTLFYGAAAHSTLALDQFATASFGVILTILAHTTGWPFPLGGAGNITSALITYYQSIGGKLLLGNRVKDLADLPPARACLLDLTPRQILNLRGIKLGWLYRKRLSSYSYGAGAFKIDWALSEPIPFLNDLCRKAGTIHIGFTGEEIEKSEKLIQQGAISDKPFILLAQHSLFDKTRAPAGKHTAWAYCHVPHNDPVDMTDLIERQIEKAAPGFRDCILHRTTHNAHELELLNPNLVGGDINGGKQDITQLFTRPVTRFSPYSTPNPKVYICSSSTPPGGGVHGMCGYHAARKVYRDHFR